MKINKKVFRTIYYQCLEDILAIRPINEELRNTLAIHDYGYRNFDFFYYLKQSWIRAWEVYKFLPDITDNTNIKILDVGALFGNFALCFKRLGYKVTTAEAYDYYNGVFDNLKTFLESEGIQIENKDFTASLPEDNLKKYNIVLCLAVLEHLAHSPANLLNNIKNSLSLEGFLLLEVPNIAYWPKRLQLLKGESILSSIEEIYKSEEPYMGHHHEYTLHEIKQLAQLSNFQIEKIIFYNYSLDKNFKAMILKLLYSPAILFKSCKEIMLVKLKPKDDARHRDVF